jgi:hypothetical protein
MNNYTWSVNAARDSGVEAPAKIGERYIRILDVLSAVDPALSGWTILGNRCSMEDLLAWAEDGDLESAPIQSISIDDARRNPAELVEANVHRDDWGEPQPDECYSLVANNKYNRTPRNVCVSVTAGSMFDYNTWRVDLGKDGSTPPDPSIVTYKVMSGIFRAMTSLWPKPWAMVRGSSAIYEDRPGIVGRTIVETFRHDITWMGYLSAQLAAGFEPPLGLISERLGDGGVLLTSTEDRPDPANADQMRRSDLLTAIMDRYASGG